jgi:hypothetical protein
MGYVRLSRGAPMLIESDAVLATIDLARKRAKKIFEMDGKDSYADGRYEGLNEAYGLVEALVDTFESGAESFDELETID